MRKNIFNNDASIIDFINKNDEIVVYNTDPANSLIN